jgi:uncharacterized protein YfaS (alpha-2-macroglobulin family)
MPIPPPAAAASPPAINATAEKLERGAQLAAGRAPALQAKALQAKEAQEQAPTKLYFDPQLATDAQGFVNIEFVMPPVDSQYRVLIDALGRGRVGSYEQQLIVGGSQGAK